MCMEKADGMKAKTNRGNWLCPICKNVLYRDKQQRTPRTGYCSFCIAIDDETKVKLSLEKSLKDNALIWKALAELGDDHERE